jgi:predicted nucleic acid-binding protein
VIVDASAVVEVLLGTPSAIAIERRIFTHGESLHAPHLIDLEVAQVLRRLVNSGAIASSRGDEALADLLAFPIHRYAHDLLLNRVWALRHNFTAYDASYIALAEGLDHPLVTHDRKMASAKGHAAKVEVI